jgi:hypothetical protein
MQLTKELFDQLRPGEIFRVVTTRVQALHAPMEEILTFVCQKGKSGIDWTIYGSRAGAQPDDIARYGDKVQAKENIQSLCPCDPDVMDLYRH